MCLYYEDEEYQSLFQGKSIHLAAIFGMFNSVADLK